MKLENIGFYTLCNYRAAHTSASSPLWRCELILTSRCNFACPYCRGVKPEYRGDIPVDRARAIINLWADQGLKNIRFSGGEPTLYPYLGELVSLAKRRGVERIAISTNGSAPSETYLHLCGLGVNDFSISLDACCAADAEKMAGTSCDLSQIMSNVRLLSRYSYTTVGVVLTEHNQSRAGEIATMANDLGASDIRLIPAAQYGKNLPPLPEINKPIYSYRRNNILRGRAVRGLDKNSARRCWIVLDDMAVIGDDHYPCIIYLREGGRPIGKIGGEIRKERQNWFLTHNPKRDEICKNNCLDVCIDYNLKCQNINLNH